MKNGMEYILWVENAKSPKDLWLWLVERRQALPICYVSKEFKEFWVQNGEDCSEDTVVEWSCRMHEWNP